MTIGRSETEIQQAIEDGVADLNLGTVPPPVGDLQRLSDDPVLARRLVETTGCVHYLTLQMDAGPTKSLAVRQAVNYAIDRQAVVLAIGGRYAGEPASTVLSPPGRPQRLLYPSQDATGGPDKARESLLAKAGHPNGVRLTYAGQSSPKWKALYEALRVSLARARTGSIPPSTTGSTSTRSRCACGPSATSTTWARPAGARTLAATAPARSASPRRPPDHADRQQQLRQLRQPQGQRPDRPGLRHPRRPGPRRPVGPDRPAGDGGRGLGAAGVRPRDLLLVLPGQELDLHPLAGRPDITSLWLDPNTP